MSKQALHIVKIGGNIIDAPKALASFLADFASIQGPKLLVHGLSLIHI
jgi:acetylglutamate kinase